MNRYIADQSILEELVTITAEKLGLSEPYVVEKDLYVTLAIDILSKVENPHFKLIFQGGTCLAKAHHLVKRMSEDCDFRIVHKGLHSYSNEEQRKYLREFRIQLVEALQRNGFMIDAQSIKVHNEGQFIEISATYSTIFPVAKVLKPHLALELFLGELRTSSESQLVTTMIQQTFREKIGQPDFFVEVMSIVENAAEKWVALTRRISAIQYSNNKYDHNLIRHLYDLYKIVEHGSLNANFPSLVMDIINNDSEKFKSQNPQYYQSPEREITLAIKSLQTDPKWQKYWNEFMQIMVFDSHKPDYQTALTSFLAISVPILYELGKKEELRNWQLEKMRVGLQQAQNNYVASEQDVARVFNKCKIAK